MRRIETKIKIRKDKKAKKVKEIEKKAADCEITVSSIPLLDLETMLKPKTKNNETETSERKSKKTNKKEIKNTETETSKTNGQKIKKPENKNNKNNIKEKVDYMTVIGYDAMYKLENDPTVKITDFKTVGRTLKKRTNVEMLSSRREYLDINRAFVEDNFRLKKINNEYQERIRELEVKTQTILETSIKKLKNFGESMLKQKEWQENTLKNIFKSIAGEQFVGNEYQQWVKAAYKEIELEKNLTLLQELKTLTNAIKELLYSSAEKAGLHKTDIDNLIEKLKIAGEKPVGEPETQ